MGSQRENGRLGEGKMRKSCFGGLRVRKRETDGGRMCILERAYERLLRVVLGFRGENQSREREGDGGERAPPRMRKKTLRVLSL